MAKPLQAACRRLARYARSVSLITSACMPLLLAASAGQQWRSEGVGNDHSLAFTQAGKPHVVFDQENRFPPRLTGKAAEIELQKDGRYESLAAAFHAAQYAVDKLDPVRPHSRGAQYFASNPKQKIRAWFGANGVELAGTGEKCHATTRWDLSLRFRAWGRNGSWRNIGTCAVRAKENRIEMSNPDDDLVEWWENKTVGFEHGFTINHAPVGPPGVAQLLIAYEGDVCAKSAGPDRISFVTNRDVEVAYYGQLTVKDATGRRLDAWLDAKGDDIAICVCDVGARYPLVIDPLFASEETSLVGNEDHTGAQFGSSVALDGGTAAIGTPLEDTSAGTDAGAVYLFRTDANSVGSPGTELEFAL